MIDFMPYNLRCESLDGTCPLFHYLSCQATVTVLYLLATRIPGMERQPSSVLYSLFLATILRFIITTTIGLLQTAMILTFYPIILAAIPTHRSRFARSVSGRSVAMEKSSAVASRHFCPGKTGS